MIVVRINKQNCSCVICKVNKTDFTAESEGKEYAYCSKCAPYIANHINKVCKTSDN